MTRALSTVISLLLRMVAPLIRRGLRHLAMAAMATVVALAAVAAGHGLILVALWLPPTGWVAATVVALLGAAIRLAGLVALASVAVLVPLVVAADCLAPAPTASEGEHRRRAGRHPRT
ncbi:hypothetical protein ACIRQF_31460 [Streptomyces sp. NPDC101191]|uniref:hypothetical protein n=1 Tax=Streptomyces sp. NPDC101191 TaxID=3366126 RepID=UPI00381F5E91